MICGAELYVKVNKLLSSESHVIGPYFTA